MGKSFKDLMYQKAFDLARKRFLLTVYCRLAIDRFLLPIAHRILATGGACD